MGNALNQCRNVSEYCDCNNGGGNDGKTEIIEEAIPVKKEKEPRHDFEKKKSDQTESTAMSKAKARPRPAPVKKDKPETKQPKPAPKAAKASAPKPKAKTAPVQKKTSVITEALLYSDLYKTEDGILRQIFQKFDDTNAGRLSLDQISVLHNFIKENTCLEDEGDIQEKIYMSLDDTTMYIYCDSFIKLMRNHVANEQDAIKGFLSMGPETGSNGIDIVDSFNTRSSLRMIGEQSLVGPTQVLSDDQWESILDCAMSNVDFEVNMEDFTNIYTKLATILRAQRLLQTL
eukprot:Platyproteum_vivax@DN595_c0_g1_i2.p1